MHHSEENEGPVTSEKIKPNWLAIFLTVFFLIVIGWALGLIAHPPVAEMINCPEEDMVEIIGVPEGGVVVICVDYTE